MAINSSTLPPISFLLILYMQVYIPEQIYYNIISISKNMNINNKYMRPERPVHRQLILFKFCPCTKLTGPQAHRCLQVKGEKESMHFNFTSLCTSVLEGNELWNWILIAHSNPKAPAFFFCVAKLYQQTATVHIHAISK